MIFENTFFTEMLLPFLLTFVVIFAILQKSKILGDGKAKIDALVSFVIGLILIVTPVARDFLINLMPWIAVGVGVILMFFVLYGFVAGDLTNMPKGLKITFGILAGLFTVGIVLYVSGFGEYLYDTFSNGISSGLVLNAFIVLLVVGAIIWVVLSSSKAEGKGSGKKEGE